MGSIYLDDALSAFITLREKSPFAEYRDIVASENSSGDTLRLMVMSLYNEQAYPFPGRRMCNLDEAYFAVAVELLTFYQAHGENDAAFLDLVRDIEARCLVEPANARTRTPKP